MSFFMFSNSGYYILKFVEKNSDVYEPIIEESSSMLSLKTFVKKRTLLLAILHYTYTKKMG